MTDPYALNNEIWPNKIIKHSEEDPADLLANPLNFRIHNEMQQSATVGSLDSVGWVKSVIVNINTNTVIDGHERIMIAMRKQGQKVPVEWVDLTEEEEAIALLSLDFIASMAGIDAQKLFDLSTAVPLDEIDFDLGLVLKDFVVEHSNNGEDTSGIDLSQFKPVDSSNVLYRVVIDGLSRDDAAEISKSLDSSRIEQYRGK